MIIFKSKIRNQYLITNYKVMYSTLNKQDNIKRVTRGRCILKVITKYPHLSNVKFYLIVRNPFNRIESFYKDKFLKAEKHRLWMIDQGYKKNWQNSTEIFFPYLGLNTEMDPSFISKKLELVTFEQFISILPKVYMHNPHLWPQYFAKYIYLSISPFKIKIPFQFKETFRIESKPDLNRMATIFDIDLNKKMNTTQKIKRSIKWSDDAIETIQSLYDHDFKQFDYLNLPPYKS